MIHIVLVNFNGTADTIACVKSLSILDNGPLTVTIVDNRSREEERERLRAWTSAQGSPTSCAPLPRDCEGLSRAGAGTKATLRLNLVLSSQNLGFAGGNNIGLALAKADPAMRYVWVLNNDTEVHPEALTALSARMDRDQSIGMCGSTLIYHDDRTMVQAVGGRFNALLARPEQIAGGTQFDALPAIEDVERELDYVIGASMLVSRDYLNAIGAMDEGYFLYFEELDWAERGRKDFRLGWAPNSIVYHKEGGAIGTSSRTRPSDVSLYYMWRSAVRFLCLHRPALLPLGIMRLGGKASQYAMQGDRKAAIVMARALVHALAGRVGRTSLN